MEAAIFAEFVRICQERGVQVETEILQRIPPAPCSKEFQSAAKKACQEMGLKYFCLPSGAGHVPCKRLISVLLA